MVNVVKKLPHIALQDKRWLRIVRRYFPRKDGKPPHARVRPLADAGRKGIMDKGFIKDLIQCLVHGLIQHAVPHARDMNEPWLRVGNPLADIGVVRPCALRKQFMQREQMLFKTKRERRDIGMRLFPLAELLPRREQICDRNYITESDTMTPPPTKLP